MTMHKQISIKVAIWLINFAITLLPAGYKNRTFINNCIATNIIKAENK